MADIDVIHLDIRDVVRPVTPAIAAPPGGLTDAQVRDVVGQMITAAGGTYNPTGGTITLPPQPSRSVVISDDGAGTVTITDI